VVGCGVRGGGEASLVKGIVVRRSGGLGLGGLGVMLLLGLCCVGLAVWSAGVLGAGGVAGMVVVCSVVVGCWWSRWESVAGWGGVGRVCLWDVLCAMLGGVWGGGR